MSKKKKSDILYWKKRKWKEETALADIEEYRLNRKLAEEYLRMQKDIIRDMENLYLKIMQEGGSDVALVSHLYQYNGYYETLATIQQRLIKMGSTEIEQITSSLQHLYIANGKRVTKQFNIPFDPTDEQVRNVINKIWAPDKLRLSDRVWKNQTELQNRLNATLVDAVAKGAKVDDLALGLTDLTKKFSDDVKIQFAKSFHSAQRLVRTETSRIMVDSAVDAYAEAGVDKYEVLADQSGVCEHCEEFNGKIFRIADQSIGINCPPFHPNCRCTVLAWYYDDLGGYNID